MKEVRIGRDVKLAQPRREQLDAPSSSYADPFSILDRAREAGLDGVLVRTLVEWSPTLDAAFLRDVADHAQHLGLYLELGVGKVNPYMTAELPEVRDLGDGDYLAGMRRLIEAAAAIGCHELWTATAYQKPATYGVHAVDRFRTDVTWAEQVRATTALITELAPVLRDHGSHLNLETHEEITSGELARIIDAVGADVVGVTFDPANAVARGEHPQEVAERLGSAIRQTHLRDVALFADGADVVRFLAPCGAGVLDWDRLLATLLTASPDLHLTIEGSGAHRGRLLIPRSDPRWIADFDAAVGGADPLDDLVAEYHRLVTAGRRPGPEPFAAGRLGDIDEFVGEAARFLRERCEHVSLP